MRKQLREAPADRVREVRRALRHRVDKTAREAYIYGREHDRAFAARYLLDLARRNRTRYAAVAARLLALGVPESLALRLGAVSRALAGYKKRALVRYHARQ